MTKNSTPPSTNRPTHLAFHVREDATKEPFWTRIGAAWPHKDGGGFQVQLETLPLNGRITLRIAKDATA